MKTDLHFHPSFFNRRAGFQLTEWRVPRLKEIVRKAFRKNLDMLAITSCSTSEHIDPRWEEYLRELEEKGLGTYSIETLPQGLRIGHKGLTNTLYLIHGQELKTDKWDVNVLFASQRVPIANSNGKFGYIIDAANDSGENVLVGLNEIGRKRGKDLSEDCRIILDLYDKGKLHFIESYNAMDFVKNNNYARAIADSTALPGIAVSDGHRLVDMARASTTFDGVGMTLRDYGGDFNGLVSRIKSDLKDRVFRTHEKPCSLISKGLYFARLSEAVVKSRLGLLR